MKFEDAQLLDHPTVHEAFDAMANYFKDSKGFHKHAVRAAEVLSVRVSHPDPDVVAAAIFMPPAVIAKVSTKAAKYAEQYFDTMDRKKKAAPVSEPVKQLVLAHAVVDLQDVREDIESGKYWSARQAQHLIDKSAMPLHAATDTVEQGLAQTALAELHSTQQALQNLIATAQAKAVFEKQGLPDHPTLRQAYEIMRTSETSHDPLYDNQSGLGARTARVLFETGASTDPDVLGAALLNQYHRPVPGNLTEALLKAVSLQEKDKATALIKEYKDKNPDPLEKVFPARLVELYRETSPLGGRERTAERSEEAQLIIGALYVHVLESQQEEYLEYQKMPKSKYDKGRAIVLLEHIEHYAEQVETFLQHQTHAGLKARMEKAVSDAQRLMYAPENKKIRKPGSPAIDRGW